MFTCLRLCRMADQLCVQDWLRVPRRHGLFNTLAVRDINAGKICGTINDPWRRETKTERTFLYCKWTVLTDKYAAASWSNRLRWTRERPPLLGLQVWESKLPGWQRPQASSGRTIVISRITPARNNLTNLKSDNLNNEQIFHLQFLCFDSTECAAD